MKTPQLPALSTNDTETVPFQGALLDFGEALCQHFEADFALGIGSAYPQVSTSIAQAAGTLGLRVILEELAAAKSLSLPRTRASYNRMVNSIRSSNWGDYLLTKYPELSRLADALRMRLIYSGEVAAQFREISLEHKTYLGIRENASIVDMEPRGDVHAHGSSTVLLTLNDGMQIFYKPSHAGNVLLVQSLLEMVNPQLTFPLHLPRTLAVGNAHLQEALAPESNFDQATRLHQFGSWLSLSDALGLTDLHMENVVETSNGPVIIDFECFPSPDYKERRLQNPLPSIARSGLLPAPFTFAPNAPLVDWSALAGEADRIAASWAIHYIADDGLPTVHLVEDSLHDAPTKGTNPGKLDPTATSEIALLAGYSQTKAALEAVAWDRMRDLAQYYRPEVRIVVRPTQIYQNCLRRSSYPTYLRSRAARENALRSWLTQESLDSEVLDREVAALSDFTIPSFCIDPETRQLGGAKIIAPFQALETSFAEATSPSRTRQVKRYVRQIFEVRQSDPTVMPVVTYPATVRLTGQGKLKILSSVVESIITLGHSSSFGPTWINAQKDQDGSWIENGYSPYLYSGVSGIYLALAELSNHLPLLDSRLPGLLDAISIQLSSILAYPYEMLSTGLFEGAGGILYALSVGNNPAQLNDAAVRYVNLATEHLDLLGYDLISGSAGVLLLASRFADAGILTEHMTALQLACLEHLSDRGRVNREGLRVWDESEDWVGGLSHGPAGIAWAVKESAFAYTYQSLANDAWQTQLSLLLPDGHSWKNRRLSEEPPLCAWCHGTEGIALMLHSTAPDSPIYSRQVAALKEEPLPSNPSLCHGLAGRYLTLHELDLEHEAASAAADLWSYADCHLGELSALDDSLMTGRAGVLLALLHDYTGGSSLNPLKVQVRV